MSITRAFNSLDRDTLKGVVTKYSSNAKLLDELAYLNTVQTMRCAPFFPRVTQHVLQGVQAPKINGNMPYWYTMELYDYSNFYVYTVDHFLRNYSPNALHNIRDTLLILDGYTSDWESSLIGYSSGMMYRDKTFNEQWKFAKGHPDRALFEKEITLNGTKYKGWNALEYSVSNLLQEFALFKPVIIHGDCCFSNILVSEKQNLIKFIDPRGSFGVKGIYGDRRYDLAKLYHSVDGRYEDIIYDKFIVESDGTEFKLGFLHDKLIVKLDEFVNLFLPTRKLHREVKIIQGCIFLGMCARHYDSIERQTAMYLQGIRILNEALDMTI